jgi:hypothetical protein
LLIALTTIFHQNLAYAGAGVVPSIDLKPDFRRYMYVKEDVLKGRIVYQEDDSTGPLLVRYIDRLGNPRLMHLRPVENPDKPQSYWLLTEANERRVELYQYIIRPDHFKVSIQSDIHIPIFPKKIPLNYIGNDFLAGEITTKDWKAYDSDITNEVKRHRCKNPKWIKDIITHGATYSGVFTDREASETMLGKYCKAFFEDNVLGNESLDNELLFQAIVQLMSGYNPTQYNELFDRLRAEGHVPTNRLNGDEWIAREVDIQRYLTQQVCKKAALQTLFERGATLETLLEGGQVTKNLASESCAEVLIQHTQKDTSLPRLALYKHIIERDKPARDEAIPYPLAQEWLKKIGPPISLEHQQRLLQFALDSKAYSAITLLGSAGMQLDEHIDEEGNTALHLAVMEGNVVLASALVRGGASILALNIHGETPSGLSKAAYDKEANRLNLKKDNHFKLQFYQAWLYPFFRLSNHYAYQKYLDMPLEEQHFQRALAEEKIALRSDEFGPDQTITLEEVNKLLTLYPFCAECLRARANAFRMSGKCLPSYQDFASARLLSQPDKYSIAREMKALADCGIPYNQYDPNSKHSRHWGKYSYTARQNTEWTQDFGWLHDMPPEDQKINENETN